MEQDDVNQINNIMSKELKDYREDFYYFTGKASEVNRQLALAGIAIIWIFKNPENSTKLFPKALIEPILYLITSLSLDLLQYIVGALIWGLFFEYKEYQVNRKEIKKTDIKAPNFFSWIITGLFILKIIAMILAFKGLFYFFLDKI